MPRAASCPGLRHMRYIAEPDRILQVSLHHVRLLHPINLRTCNEFTLEEGLHSHTFLAAGPPLPLRPAARRRAVPASRPSCHALCPMCGLPDRPSGAIALQPPPPNTHTPPPHPMTSPLPPQLTFPTSAVVEGLNAKHCRRRHGRDAKRPKQHV